MTTQNVPVQAQALPACQKYRVELPKHLQRRLLNSVEASEYLDFIHSLRVAPNTLSKWRTVGGGPDFHKAGRWVYYSHDALDTWAADKLSPSVASTSELGR